MARPVMAGGPVEPPDTGIRFPAAESADEHGLVAVGVDFRPGTLLRAYRNGIFPWPQSERLVGWFSPDPRAIFPLAEPPRISRSMKRTLRLSPWTVRVDGAFDEVVVACGEQRSGGTWITRNLLNGYRALFHLGWAHCVEVREGEELVGGIYGVAINGLFAGESMFHRRTDASKVAFIHLVQRLRLAGYRLFDVQVQNPHIESLGCIEIPRTEYLERVSDALSVTTTELAPGGPVSAAVTSSG
ncbi:leucyl/phenylalanyl-tRNA--protein transferase [soil metagenome]